jgi:hypothetical protein
MGSFLVLYALLMSKRCDPESSYLIIEDQAFSPSYDLAPSPYPLPHPSVSSTGDTQETEKERQLADRRRRKGREKETNHTTARKPPSL